MKNHEITPRPRPFATLGLIGFFFLLALTCAVHLHAPTVDHTQSECPLCLLGTPNKVFVISPATASLHLAVDAVIEVATLKLLSLLLWDNTPSRSPPSLA